MTTAAVVLAGFKGYAAAEGHLFRAIRSWKAPVVVFDNQIFRLFVEGKGGDDMYIHVDLNHNDQSNSEPIAELA